MRIEPSTRTAALAEYLRTMSYLLEEDDLPVTFQDYTIDLIILNLESNDDPDDKVIIARVFDVTTGQKRAVILGRPK